MDSTDNPPLRPTKRQRLHETEQPQIGDWIGFFNGSQQQPGPSTLNTEDLQSTYIRSDEAGAFPVTTFGPQEYQRDPMMSLGEGSMTCDSVYLMDGSGSGDQAWQSGDVWCNGAHGVSGSFSTQWLDRANGDISQSQHFQWTYTSIPNSFMPQPFAGQLQLGSSSYQVDSSVDYSGLHSTTFGTTANSLDDELVCVSSGESPKASRSEIAVESTETVCFGTILSIPGRILFRDVPSTNTRLCVELKSGSSFVVIGEPDGVEGVISAGDGYNQMIQEMINDDELQLYAMCDIKESANGKFVQVPCGLDITVYGPAAEFEGIGDWFQGYNIYLQDPRDCHMDAQYCNPHKLSFGGIGACPMVSEMVSQTLEQIIFKDVTESMDVLDILRSRSDLEEAAQPGIITAELKRHQKQALTFMLNRERGWAFDGRQSDIWKVIFTAQRRSFVNMITESVQDDEPPPFCGGIIADPMGLGKTLTMISLVATDTEKRNEELDLQKTPNYVGATLIVVPPPLLSSWEEQLSEHVIDGKLIHRRHHGKSKMATTKAALNGINVVLTTYHTVSADWKSGAATQTSPLFMHQWKRVILDEAHLIRNNNSRMAGAVCALESVSRWAVTGTPIQNRLSDLATLVKFIRAYPYTDTKQFELDLVHLWKSGHDETATQRLKKLSACLILRRPKGTISLPPKHDKLCAVEFTPDERIAYSKMRQGVIAKNDSALSQDSGCTKQSQTAVYHNALQQIESLRLFCNLGLGYDARHEIMEQESTPNHHGWNHRAQHMFNLQCQEGSIACLICSSTCEMDYSILDHGYAEGFPPRYFECLQFTCSDCVRRSAEVNRTLSCGHKPSCISAPIFTDISNIEHMPSSGVVKKAVTDCLPSKVRVLIADLKRQPPGVKSIVFSTWRMTLRVVEQALEKAGKSSVRFDGSISHKERDLAVERFRKDPATSVMLLTLSCGAVGCEHHNPYYFLRNIELIHVRRLTLTVATRVYLMEPHWNPNLEEQALARVYRIGQTREVTTIRLYIRDSFEERVMEVQQTKKQLSGLILSPHDGDRWDDSLNGLEKLRSLL